MSMTPITVTGTFETANADGSVSAAIGTVSAKATATMEDTAAHMIHEATLVNAALDGSGHFSFVLPATDDSTTIPLGVEYTFVVSILGQPIRTFVIPLPHTVAPFDLSAISAGG